MSRQLKVRGTVVDAETRHAVQSLHAMIAAGRQFLLIGWWMTALPGFALLVVGVALSLIGDGLADKR